MELVYPKSTNGELFPWNELRLPASVRPVNYDLSLTPNLTSMTFTGRTVINMTILHNTKHVVLHSSELIITKATFQVTYDQPCHCYLLEINMKRMCNCQTSFPCEDKLFYLNNDVFPR